MNKAFFTKAEIGTTDADAQREYVECLERGIPFTAYGMWPKAVWHWLFPREATAPELVQKYGDAKAYLFSMSALDMVVTPVNDLFEWTKTANQVTAKLRAA